MAGYLFSFVAVVFTVLTIPEDYKTKVLGTVLSEGVPWFVLLIAAGVFFAIAQVGRVAIARVQTSDDLSPPEGELAVGSTMVTRDGVFEYADPEKAEIKPEVEQLKERVSPEPQELEPGTFNSHTIDRLGEVISVAIPAMEGLGVIMARFLDRMGRNPDDGNVHRFGRLARQTLQESMGVARAHLEGLQGSGDGAAMIRALEVAYRAYLEARSWLPECSIAAGRTYFLQPDYEQWYKADEEFRKDLTKARGANSLAALNQLIHDVEQAQEIQRLEDPPS